MKKRQQELEGLLDVYKLLIKYGSKQFQNFYRYLFANTSNNLNKEKKLYEKSRRRRKKIK